MAAGAGGGAGSAGLPADLGWERLENGRRILGAFGERARGWRGGQFLAPVPEWIGELPGEDQRYLATADVRMEPSGKWLSFDARQVAPPGATDLFPWLPVTDDHEVLRRIVLRAAVLADDERLASRQLLRQIRHR